MSTLALTEAWRAEFDKVGAASDVLGDARETFRLAEQNLGAHLNPGDQQPGESISIWIPVSPTEERLVRSRLKKDGTYDLDFRGRKRDI